MGNVQSAQYMLEKLAELDCNKDRDDKEVYRIGDLAREFNVSLRTLRFYEDRGLISPERSGSTRLYSVDDRRRLKIILLIKNVGFSLIDIQEFLNLYDAGDGDSNSNVIVAKFSEQLEKLKIQRAEIDQSIDDIRNAISHIEQIA
ncbi:MAG: MerR family DNA-binding transcriptional regulator [Pseudomonadota bacterium]